MTTRTCAAGCLAMALVCCAAARPSSSDGACRFDLSGEKADTVFFVLGMLDEYLDRNIVENDDRVESMSGSAPATAVFRRQLARLVREQGSQLAFTEETINDGVVVFRSKRLTERLNSCYKFQMSDGGTMQPGPDGAYRRTTRASLGVRLFIHGGSESVSPDDPNYFLYTRRALAYLAGVWARNGRGDAIVFANSQDKARAVGQLLNWLHCGNVKMESNFGFIPQTNIIRFEPTDEVTSWLHKSW